MTFAVTANTNAALFSVAPAVSPTGTLTFTAAPDANGTATITLVLRDNGGTANGGVDTSEPQTVSITVEAVNDAPTLMANDPAAIGEDAGPRSIPNWATSSAGPADETTQTVGYTVNGVSNPQLFSTPPAVAANGTLTYTPAADANGIATFQVVVQDDGGTDSGGVDTSGPQTFTITVEAVNDVPSFTASDPPAVDEDAGPQSIPNWAAFSAGPANESAQTATYVVSSVSNPLLFSTPPAVASNGTLTYALAADATGIATFDVAVQDNGGTANGGVDSSAPQAVTITVNAINDAPVLTAAGGPLAYRENDPATAIDPTLTVIDVDSATLTGATVQITQNYHNGEDVLSFADTATITGTFSAASGLLTLTGTDTVANYRMALRAVRYQNSSENPVTADRTITWLATDGITPSVAWLRTITVAAVNDNPSFTGGANHVSVQRIGQRIVSSWASGISAGPGAESAQGLTFVVTGNTNPGMFSAGPAVSSNGTLTYTAADNGPGTATITLVVQDNGGTANGGVDTSAPHTFTITIMDNVQVTLQKTLTTAPANLDMPESYRLRIAVENITGVLELTSIGPVVETLPPGTVFNGATPQADCQPGCAGTTPATLTWTSPCAEPLMPGSSCDITINVTFPSATFPSGTNVTSSFTTGATVLFASPQTFGPAETTHAVTTLVPSPSASFSKNMAEGTPTPPTLNQTFSYDLNIVNDGNVPLDSLVVIDTLPVEMSVTSITTGAYTGLSDFGPGEGVRVSYEKNTAPGVFTLWGSSPNTSTNTLLTAPPPGLGAGEFLTRIRWEYGQAGPGMGASSASTRPLVTGQIINPGNAGGPVAIGDSIQNCAALTAVYTTGPTSVNRSDCEAFSVGGPFVQLDPAKENLTDFLFTTGDPVDWRLRVRSAPQSSDPVPLENLVVTDLVPVGLTVNAWTFDDQATGLPAPQSFEQIPNFAGTGRTLLRWRWNAGSGSLGVGQQVWITIATTVNGALLGGPFGLAWITNTFALDHDALGVALRCAGSSSLDAQDVDGDGNTSETLCTGSGTIVTNP